MTLMTSLLMAALAVLSLSNTDGFSIRRTARPQPHASSADLKDAARILQRQRRRALQQEDYLDPRSAAAAMLLSRDALEDVWAPPPSVPRDGGPLWLSQALQLSPYADAYPDDFSEEPGFLAGSPPHREVTPSDQELDAIFSQGDDENDDDDSDEGNKIIVPAKDAAKVAALAAAEEEDEAKEEERKKKMKMKKKSSSPAAVASDGDSVTLSKEEFRALMSAVKKLEREISGEDRSGGAVVAASPVTAPHSTADVSQEELARVFEAAEQEDNGDNAAQEGEDDEEDDDQGSIQVIDENLPDSALPIPETDSALQESIQALAASAGKEKVPQQPQLSQLDKYLLLKSMYDEGEDEGEEEEEDKRKKRFTKRAPTKRSGMSLVRAGQQQQQEQEEEGGEHFDALSVEIANLVKEIQTLRQLARLEDLENDALTEALNEATIGQMEGVVSPREAKAIQKAIRIEEALNQLPVRQQILGPPLLQAGDVLGDESDDDGEEGEDDDLKAKRGEPLWRKRQEEDEEEEEEDDEGLQAFQDDLGTWYNQPLPTASLEEPRDDQEERDRLIWELSKQLAPEEAKELDKGPQVCPAVAALSTNCQFADDYRLPIDDEARDLCNRHQICYACGGSFSIRRQICDEGFRGEAERLCGGESSCRVEAELFLRALQLKHVFQERQLPLCQQSACAAEYVGLV